MAGIEYWTACTQESFREEVGNALRSMLKETSQHTLWKRMKGHAYVSVDVAMNSSSKAIHSQTSGEVVKTFLADPV